MMGALKPDSLYFAEDSELDPIFSEFNPLKLLVNPLDSWLLSGLRSLRKNVAKNLRWGRSLL